MSELTNIEASDLTDFRKLLDKLKREGRKFEKGDELTESLGGEKFPYATREIVKEMVFIIEDNPLFARHVPAKLRDFFSGYKVNWRGASVRADFTMTGMTRELLKVAKEILGKGTFKVAFQPDVGETSLAGMSKVSAKRHVNHLLSRYTRGLFNDDSWRPVNIIFKALTAAQINWELKKTQYRENDQGIPSSKEWKFEIHFLNNRGRENVLYGIIIAAGAGSVEDPLDRYDLVAYVS